MIYIVQYSMERMGFCIFSMDHEDDMFMIYESGPYDDEEAAKNMIPLFEAYNVYQNDE